MNVTPDETSKAEEDLNLYPAEKHQSLKLAQATLPVRRLANALRNVATGIALVAAVIFISGHGSNNVEAAAWVSCILSGCAAAGFDLIRRRLLRLKAL